MFRKRLSVLRFIALGISCLVVWSIGCFSKIDHSAEAVLAGEDSEFVLTIMVDLSGSYQRLMAEDGKAYDFCMRVIDRYFRDRLASNDRLIIGQVSATKNSVLWDGRPLELRQAFPSSASFRDFLLKKSNPNGSIIHDGVADAVEYTMSFPGVAKGKTKTAVLVLSDMLDNGPEPEKSEKRLVEALTKYGQIKGAVGLYWVAQPMVPTWRRHLEKAGIRNAIVASDIVHQPDLPVID